MNQEWKEFLAGLSADFDEEGQARWNNNDPQPADGLCDLSHLGLAEVAGEDAEKLLQGQFTNDVRQIDAEHWSISAYCSPKGRMIASFRMLRLGDSYVMQMPAATHALLMKRLPMFVLMAKAEVRDPAPRLASFGCWGEGVAARLKERFGELPGETGAARQIDHGVILRLPGEAPRFLLVGETAAMKEVWTALGEQAVPADFAAWRLQEIRAGYPTVHGETTEAFVPQMCNLQLINGVSFTKGCFVGQEVVARMKYLGKLKRQMYLAKCDSAQPPRPGDGLFSPDSKSGQGAGTVVDAVPSPHGGHELLVVAEIAAAEGSGVHLQDATGPEVDLNPPPYGFEEG